MFNYLLKINNANHPMAYKSTMIHILKPPDEQQ